MAVEMDDAAGVGELAKAELVPVVLELDDFDLVSMVASASQAYSLMSGVLVGPVGASVRLSIVKLRVNAVELIVKDMKPGKVNTSVVVVDDSAGAPVDTTDPHGQK